MTGRPGAAGDDEPRTLRARWVFPGAGPPLRAGRVAIAGGRVVAVDDRPAEVGELDLGDAAIVPGFVNAHTHLELGPIPRDEADGPEDEVAWLGQVIRSRVDRTPADVDALIRRNLAAAIAAGTTALGDITTAGQSWAAVAGSPVRGTVFAEILGLSPARSRATWREALAWLVARRADAPGAVRAGLSPHAPYSTAGWLYAGAAAAGVPLATHLGEMPAEREFLSASRSGPLREFVAGLGAWVDDWMPLGRSPVDYATWYPPPLDRADWIIAHGNILEPDEYARLVADRSDPAARRFAVAYCPRTHARFGHPPHPFRGMLAAGVVVCLGTDSLASSPTLSILDELRFLRRRHPDVPPATLLAMATANGAWALRLDDGAGTLAPGHAADLAVLPLTAAEPADPHDAWLRGDAPPLATMVRGRFVAGRWAS